MKEVNHAIIESIGLKLWDLEHQATYDETNNSTLWAEIKGIQWVATLLGITNEVSDIRQKQTELSNKTFQAGKNSANI